jgi:hypothetical protein
MKWIDEYALIIEIEEGQHTGVWRHARFGGWCRYEGSAYSTGESAPPELQEQLNKFAGL